MDTRIKKEKEKIKMSVPTSEEELLRDSHFIEFLRATYSELPLEEVIYQFKQSDQATKGLIRKEYFEWRRQRGYFGEVKASGKDDLDMPLPV
jgi:hypothetical protein